MLTWLDRRFSLSLSGMLCLAFVMCPGCGSSGPPLAPVTGTVLLDGNPVAGLLVEFQPIQNGRPSMAYTDQQGRFKLQFTKSRWGAMPGEHRVMVSYERDPDAETPQPKVKIPKRYNEATELRHEVVKGKNHVELALVSDPVKVGNARKTARR